MPRTWDRRQPKNDKDPTRNDLDYDDPAGVIGEGAERSGGVIHDLFSGIGQLFNLPTPQDILTGIAGDITELWKGATHFIDAGKTFFANLIGGFVDTFQIPILDPSKIFNLPGLFDDVVDIATGIFNGWFGSGGTGTAEEVTYTIEAIKDAVINGYTVSTFTSSTANWAVPTHTEMTAVLIGGGENGHGGSGTNGQPGGDGGLGGSYIAIPIDLTGITALDIAVGTANNKSYVREANTTTPHSGTVIAQSPDTGAAGGIATTLGLTLTTSTPGAGGKGGRSGSSNTSGTDGSPSGLAAGGNGGAAGNSGGVGGPGASVSAGSLIKCGGAGGGGGGGAYLAFATGGKGGAGGYPGGGGGGGGASNNSAGTSGGSGAPGVVWLFYR